MGQSVGHWRKCHARTLKNAKQCCHATGKTENKMHKENNTLAKETELKGVGYYSAKEVAGEIIHRNMQHIKRDRRENSGVCTVPLK